MFLTDLISFDLTNVKSSFNKINETLHKVRNYNSSAINFEKKSIFHSYLH